MEAWGNICCHLIGVLLLDDFDMVREWKGCNLFGVALDDEDVHAGLARSCKQTNLIGWKAEGGNQVKSAGSRGGGSSQVSGSGSRSLCELACGGGGGGGGGAAERR